MLCATLWFICFTVKGQTRETVEPMAPTPATPPNISASVLTKIDKNYARLNGALTGQSASMLDRLARREQFLRGKIAARDSSAGAAMDPETQIAYARLKGLLQTGQAPALPVQSLNAYLPQLDSMNSAIGFLSKSSAVSSTQLKQLDAIKSQVGTLQSHFQAAQQIQDFARDRAAYWKEKLVQYNLDKYQLGISKTVFYYQQQVQSLKALVTDRQKLQQQVLQKVSTLPAAQHFMQRYSWLSQLFPAPNTDSSGTLAGSQTKASVEDELSHRFGGMAANPTQYMHQQVQPASAELSLLQAKFSQSGALGNASTVDMPSFQPNTQKVKSFFKRLEFSFNIQSQKTNYLLPSTSELGLMMGYKLTDAATVGIGGSYRIGWGNAINHIHLSGQGMSFRSFLDMKIKGSWWATGGLELNDLSGYAGATEFQHLDQWQKSALFGVTKKIKIGRQGSNLQVLYDALSRDHIPRSPALIYRIGYSF